MKIRCLCWLVLFSLHSTDSRLSENFKDCLQYFFRKKIPVGFDAIAKPVPIKPDELPDGIKMEDLKFPAYICQMYNDEDYYATLYDRGRRIPLYSAYRLERRLSVSERKPSRPPFGVEPQLVFKTLGGNMLSEEKAKTEIMKHQQKINVNKRKKENDVNNVLSLSQAVNEDYTGSSYTRGHLNPNGHHLSYNARNATFTLTNVAPMTKETNNMYWGQYETKLVNDSTFCSVMYVVTGVVPGKRWIRITRVNIPSHVWSAYCCVSAKNQPRCSRAALKVNDNKNDTVIEMKVHELVTTLKTLLNITHNIELFPKNCM